MTEELSTVFRELGLSQYLDTFIDQGFDSWDIIVDITESDLDTLNVKLGHRRKLQRRITDWRNSLGIHPSSPPHSVIEDPHKAETQSCEANKSDGQCDGSNVAKRKYRRHPKPDEHAPERPPSAYVLFSNKIRDDVKSQNLSFTEIAKLVGENWQSLTPSHKAQFENKARQAKDKYNNDLVEYKKTAEYRRYMQYLQEFKKRHSNQGQAKETHKRAKHEVCTKSQPGGHSGRSNSISSSIATIGNTGANQSGSESCGGLGLRSRQRVGSSVSLPDYQFALMPTPPLSHHNSLEEPTPSPKSVHFESEGSFSGLAHFGSKQEPTGRLSSLRDVTTIPETSRQLTLPPLSDVIDDQIVRGSSFPLSMSPERKSTGDSFLHSQQRHSPLVSNDSASSIESIGVPSLYRESPSSTSSTNSFATPHCRPATEQSVPISALLSQPSDSNGPTPSLQPRQSRAKSLTCDTTGSMISMPIFQSPRTAMPSYRDSAMFGEASSPIRSGQHRLRNFSGDPMVIDTEPVLAKPTRKLDGITALLHAGEIVGRNGPE